VLVNWFPEVLMDERLEIKMATPKKTTTISLDMQVGDATFLKIAKLAHANDCTFNQMVNDLLVDAIENGFANTQSSSIPTPVSASPTVR
jgi:hypothetical protein